MRCFHPACLLLVALVSPAWAAITIDGQIDAAEWRDSRHITDFRQTEPLTDKPAALPIEGWVLATPQGLAVAMRVSQPPGVPRTGQRVQRDFEDQVDRVMSTSISMVTAVPVTTSRLHRPARLTTRS